MTAEESTKILLANDARVKKFFKAIRGLLDEMVFSAPRAEDALDIETDFERKSGVVTMDRLIVATHLMTAKLMFHVVPEHWKSLLSGIVTNFVSGVGGKAASWKIAQKIPGAGTLMQIFSGVWTIPGRLLVQAKLERDVRKACAEIRRDINAHPLTQERRRGKVQDVLTRHYRPRLTRKRKGCKSK